MPKYDLDEIERVCEAATEGPWDYVYDEEWCTEWLFCGPVRYEHGEFGSILGKWRETLWSTEGGLEMGKEDWQFIANARTWLPVLVADLRETRETIKKLEGSCVSVFFETGVHACDICHEQADSASELKHHDGCPFATLVATADEESVK